MHKPTVLKTAALVLLLFLIFNVAGIVSASALDDNYPYCITQVFNGDPRTQKGLCWSTNDTVMGSDVQIVLKGDSQPDFSQPLAEFSGTTEKVSVVSKSGVTQVRNVHKVLVTGLSPGTTYYYRVGDKAKNLWSEPGLITTEPENCSKYSFLVFADTQFWELSEAVYGTSCEKDAFAQNPDAAFALNCGDMVDAANNEDEWIERDRLGKEIYMNKTYMPVTGNHDSWNYAMYNHFNLATPPSCKNDSGVYYSFDYGDVHFIVMDSNEDGWYSQRRFTAAQLEWFKNDAASTDKKFKILLMHHPIYSGRTGPSTPEMMFYRDYFSKVISEAGIDLVLNGHTHCWSRTYPVKDAQGSPTLVWPEEKKPTTINGHEYLATINPGGTYYLTLAMSGPTQNGPNANSELIKDLLAYDASAGEAGEVQAYVRIDVEDNKLGVTCYNNSFNEHTAQIADSFAIYKDPSDTDKVALGETIVNARVLNEADFTKSSWNALQTVLTQAVNVYENYLSKENEINGAETELKAAIHALIKKGDVNADGSIKAADVLAILKHISGRKLLDEDQQDAADVTRDGKISTTDALWILQYIAERRDSF